MARGSNSRDGRSARSEFPGGAGDRGFASEGGSAGMPSPERIQAFYSPTSQLYTPLSGKEHRQFARSVLQDAFASSEYAKLGMPDSQYAMDALDTMQKMSERWTASGKAPTMAQTTEFREIAKRAVKSMNDELNQEARALRAEYNREEGGGRVARSEFGGRDIQAERNKKIIGYLERTDLSDAEKAQIAGQIIRGERDDRP